MRSIPTSFYKSRAWLACRSTYLQLHPLCEECLKRGIYTPAAHVHHITWLTEDNYTDASVSLNHANLEAVCIDCHNRIHARGEVRRRYTVDEAGRISPRVD